MWNQRNPIYSSRAERKWMPPTWVCRGQIWYGLWAAAAWKPIGDRCGLSPSQPQSRIKGSWKTTTTGAPQLKGFFFFFAALSMLVQWTWSGSGRKMKKKHIKMSWGKKIKTWKRVWCLEHGGLPSLQRRSRNHSPGWRVTRRTSPAFKRAHLFTFTQGKQKWSHNECMWRVKGTGKQSGFQLTGFEVILPEFKSRFGHFIAVSPCESP